MLRERLTEIALEHLKYSFKDVEKYSELTIKERKIITEEEFNNIKKWSRG